MGHRQPLTSRFRLGAVAAGAILVLAACTADEGSGSEPAGSDGGGGDAGGYPDAASRSSCRSPRAVRPIPSPA